MKIAIAMFVFFAVWCVAFFYLTRAEKEKRAEAEYRFIFACKDRGGKLTERLGGWTGTPRYECAER